MADTLPDVTMTREAYVELYAASGIPVGTKVLVQNKSSHSCNLALQLTEPAADNYAGLLVPSEYQAEISSGEAGIWAIGRGSVAIQVAT